MKKIIAATMCLSAFTVKADTMINLVDYELWSTTNGSDIIRVVPNGVAVNAQGCTDPDSYMVKTTLTTASIGRIYSTLLAAKMSSKPITLVIAGCETNRPAIVSVLLK